MTGEKRVIPGFPLYSCTKDGRVFKSKNGKEIRSYTNTHGAAFVGLYDSHFVSTHARLSQVVWRSWVGEIPDGLFVRHKDGDQKNCNLDNLWLTGKRMLQYPGDDIVRSIDTIASELAKISDIPHIKTHAISIIKNTFKRARL